MHVSMVQKCLSANNTFYENSEKNIYVHELRH